MSAQDLGYTPYDAWQRDVLLSPSGRNGDGFLTREELRNVIRQQEQSIGMNPKAAQAVRESRDMLSALERRNANAIAYLPPALHSPEIPQDPATLAAVREHGITKGTLRGRATELLSVAHELGAGHVVNQGVVDATRGRIQEMRRGGNITDRTAERAMLEIGLIARSLNLG